MGQAHGIDQQLREQVGQIVASENQQLTAELRAERIAQLESHRVGQDHPLCHTGERGAACRGS